MKLSFPLRSVCLFSSVSHENKREFIEFVNEDLSLLMTIYSPKLQSAPLIKRIQIYKLIRKDIFTSCSLCST